MRLVLVRHGDAVSERVDADRPLSSRGREEVLRVASRLADLGMSAPTVRHSTKLRAAQTAQIISGRLKAAGPPEEVSGLGPSDPVEAAADELAQMEGDLVLVSHLPFLPSLARRLLGRGSSAALRSLPTAGVLVLTREADGGWRLVTQLGPDRLDPDGSG